MRNHNKKIGIAILVAVIVTCIVLVFKGYHSPTMNTYIQTISQADYCPSNEWRTSTPEEQGIDSKKLADILKSTISSSGVRSLLIIRHGYLVLEGYRAPYDKDTPVDIKSVSKSILSSLTGIAIRENYIKSIDQKVTDFLPEYFENSDIRKKEITIQNLLTMTAGLKPSDPSGDGDEWCKSNDWLKYTIEKPLEGSPGKFFSYDTGLTHIMSSIITRSSGMSTQQFAKNYLFDPLGIKAGRWLKDPQGTYIGGTYMELTPRDIAKFGYLYLHDGKWNGQQIIPAEWVESSVKKQVDTGFGKYAPGYGYWWWIDKDFYFAVGWGGQYIIVNPKLDMVVVITATDHYGPLELYKSQILAAVKSNAPLKPNPAAVDKLNSLVKEFANPRTDYSLPDPELMGKINGKTFMFEKNQAGMDSFSLSFNDSSCIFKYTQIDPYGKVLTSEYPVGLNGKYQITTDSHPLYYEFNRTFFPSHQDEGVDNYPVGFEGHWSGNNRFVIRCLGALGEPSILIAFFEFKENEVSVKLTAPPTPFQFNIDGVVVSD